jgi:tetratricopeptide (TPR) repeat protein
MRRRGAGAALTLVALCALVRAADPPGSPGANEALAICRQKAATPAEKRVLLARGLALAEQAVEADERDPKAHFAVFCNLGTEMELRGVSISSVVAVRRLRREIDRTLELAPDWSDALLAKGSFLVELPRFLGGDGKEGERLIRAALAIEPDFIEAHLRLARALDRRGARAAATAEARTALALAEKKGDAEKEAEARKLLAQVGG